MNIAILDDHPMLRKGLAVLFEDEGWSVVSEAWDAESARALYYDDWDVAILDIQFPDIDGFEILKEMRQQGINKPVLVHSMLRDEVAAVQVFKEGGNGYINKCSSPENVVKAAQIVAEGGKYMSPELVALVANSLSTGQPAQPHDGLSERERQVLLLIGKGYSRSEIAQELKCNTNTISTYQARILKKLNLKSSLEIMHYAITRRLIKL